MEHHFQLAMPRGMEATQLIRDALTCLRGNPKLAECEHLSVLGALMTCAQLGLRPGVPALGEAWLLPFWDSRSNQRKAQLIIGYQGYVQLGHRSGLLASLHSRTVYENDLFDVEYGAAEDIWRHKPRWPRGEPIMFYAVGRTTNGGYAVTDPWTVADMEEHRDRFAMARNSQGQVVGPWADNFEAMASKTMLLRVMKLLPKSTEQQRAIANDGVVRVDVTPDAIDGTVVDEPEETAADGPVTADQILADENPPENLRNKMPPGGKSGQVLVSDSSSPYGKRWADPPGQDPTPVVPTPMPAQDMTPDIPAGQEHTPDRRTVQCPSCGQWDGHRFGCEKETVQDMTPDVPDDQDERPVYEHDQKDTRQLFALLRKAGIDNTVANKERRMAIFRFITGRDDIDSTNHVTPEELSDMAAILYSWDKQKVLGKKVDEILLTLVDDDTEDQRREQEEGSTTDE
jgi:recombination protein RecT